MGQSRNPVQEHGNERCNTLASRFLANNAGAISFIFALIMVPLLGFIGGAIDYAQAYRARAELQNALDSAALAAGRELDTGSSNSQAETVAQAVLDSNLGPDFPPGVTMSVNINDDTVTASASISVQTYILSALGIHDFPISATTTVSLTGGTYEVALVLDNSGSMSGSRISDLKTAATNLTNILFDADTDGDRIDMSIVPFSGSVNVGTQYATASWMDQTGQSSIHQEHFDANVTRWDMFNAIPNVGWAGCVEVRPSPHDVQDSAASGGDSMFVPLFAPDEPDNDNDYRNDYMDDDDGACPWWVSGGSQTERQSRTCKYQGEWASTSSTGATRRGPNHMCDSGSITALTDSKSTILSAIDDMEARGYTNIHHGIMWGWRTLSPEPPFDEGKSYDEPYHAKVMIVMTDGANTFPNNWSHNESWYSSYGFHDQNRLGASSNSTSALRSAMNSKTSQACENAKSAGIIVYTIAFDISDSDTVNMLAACATSGAHALTINSGDALVSAFEAIAHDINKLRISS